MKKYTEEYIQRRVKWYYECYDFIELAEYKKVLIDVQRIFLNLITSIKDKERAFHL